TARRLSQCLAITSHLMAYKSRPLNGIWGSPPYLHNGSVASLYDLLLPSDMWPRTFYPGSVEFDPVNVGYITYAGRDVFGQEQG
ncbi:c-type cytochrome, partial [Pseudomonas aeruginosa]